MVLLYNVIRYVGEVKGRDLWVAAIPEAEVMEKLIRMRRKSGSEFYGKGEGGT